MKQILLALCATATAIAAQAYTVSENLKTYAVTQSDDSIVLGTGDHGGEWNYTKDRVYDGRGLDDLSHWFEVGSDDAWAGYEVSSAKVVTRIRYLAGVDSWADRAKRMRECSFQGANVSDFSDAVTLYTIPSDMSLDDLTNGWCEVVITDSSLLSRTFKYVRFFAPAGKSGGNVAEVEFYGCDSFPSAAESAPAAPAFTSFAAINGKVTYGFAVAADAYTYRFERKYSGDADWETLDEYVYVNEGTTLSNSFTPALLSDACYRLVAVNNQGETASEVQSIPYYRALTGTFSGATADGSHDVEYAFDGDISTYYKSAEDNGWIELDLGKTKSICGVRLVPEKGQEWRNELDYIAVSDDPSFPDGHVASVTLNNSWDSLADGFVTNYSFTAVSGRYVRYYVSTVPRPCSVAEFELLTDDYTPDAAPENLVSVDATLTWDLPAVACMTTRIVRTTAPGGGTDTVTTDLRGDVLTWTDEMAIAGVRYYYAVQFVNNVGGVEYAGETATAESYVASIQIERAADDQTKLRSGMTAIQSCNDYGSADAVSSAKLFDGKTSTFGDLEESYGKIGVDLGAAYVVTSFKLTPRYDASWDESWQRSDGAVLAGSNDSAWYNNATAISEQCALTGGDEATFAATGAAAYRYVFLQKESSVTSGYTSSFYGNVAELKLFGYPASALDVLLAPEATAQWKGPRVELTWAAAQNAETYTVERRTDGGAWEPIASGLTATAYTDGSVTSPKHTYVYRVSSVKGDTVAYTADLVPTGTPTFGLTIVFR